MNLRNKTLARAAFAGLALIGLSAIPSFAQTTGKNVTNQQQMHQNHQKMTPKQMRQHHEQMMKKMTPEQMRQHHEQMMKKNPNSQKPQQMNHKM